MGKRHHQPRIEGPGGVLMYYEEARLLLHKAQGARCAHCGGGMHPNPHHAHVEGAQITVDHVIPRSKGGSDALGNRVAMHKGCNSHKGDRWPNGCELIWLLAVNARLGVHPVRW